MNIKWIGSPAYRHTVLFQTRRGPETREVVVPLRRNPMSGYLEALVGEGEPLIVRYLGDPLNPRHEPDWDAIIELARQMSGIPLAGAAEYRANFHLLPAEDRLKWRELATLQWLLATETHAAHTLAS